MRPFRLVDPAGLPLGVQFDTQSGKMLKAGSCLATGPTTEKASDSPIFYMACGINSGNSSVGAGRIIGCIGCTTIPVIGHNVEVCLQVLWRILEVRAALSQLIHPRISGQGLLRHKHSPLAVEPRNAIRRAKLKVIYRLSSSLP